MQIISIKSELHGKKTTVQQLHKKCKYKCTLKAIP